MTPYESFLLCMSTAFGVVATLFIAVYLTQHFVSRVHIRRPKRRH